MIWLIYYHLFVTIDGDVKPYSLTQTRYFLQSFVDYSEAYCIEQCHLSETIRYVLQIVCDWLCVTCITFVSSHLCEDVSDCFI